MSAQQLNEWGLPIGAVPHNPDGLTPEQITEGGLYRAVTLEECDGRHGMDGSNCQEVWNSGRWLPAMLGKNLDCSYRVPITTPLPAVKESLTPQPATGQIEMLRRWQRLTKDQMKELGISSYDGEEILILPGSLPLKRNEDIHPNAQDYFSESEIKAMPIFKPCPDCDGVGPLCKYDGLPHPWAMSQVDEKPVIPSRLSACNLTPRTDANLTALKKVGYKYGFSEAVLLSMAEDCRTLETELNAALAQRDEARRLLGEAVQSLKLAASRIEGLRIQTHHKSPSRTEAYNWAQETLNTATQITNHLNK